MNNLIWDIATDPLNIFRNKNRKTLIPGQVVVIDHNKYTVEEGDSLASIAEKVYGDQRKVDEVYKAIYASVEADWEAQNLMLFLRMSERIAGLEQEIQESQLPKRMRYDPRCPYCGEEAVSKYGGCEGCGYHRKDV